MKKGFTLIELLAVIVILAIIALIATPIILNIVEDSKKSAVTESAKLYIAGLQNRIASENMTREFNPSSCTITNGNISCDGQSIDYTVDGQAPTSGTITFNNGVISGYTLCISDYKVTKSGNNVTSEKAANCVAVNTVYAPGDLVQYDPVNNTACTTGETCYNWRVITVGDITSNATLTLQMNHNLINTEAWVSQVDYNDDTNWNYYRRNNKGPITALKALETATASWDDSLKLNYTYDTSLGGANTGANYGILSCANGTCTISGNQVTTNLKARMITGEELSALTVAAGALEGTKADSWTVAGETFYYFSNTARVIGTTSNVATGDTGDTSLSWLVENTYEDANSGATANTYGATNYCYWTLSPRASIYDYAWIIHGSGQLHGNSVDYDNSCGIRPVITIPKSIFD